MSKQCAEHPFAGQNTQHSCSHFFTMLFAAVLGGGCFVWPKYYGRFFLFFRPNDDYAKHEAVKHDCHFLLDIAKH